MIVLVPLMLMGHNDFITVFNMHTNLTSQSPLFTHSTQSIINTKHSFIYKYNIESDSAVNVTGVRFFLSLQGLEL